MKVIIAGSRDITDFDIIKQAIKDSEFKITEIVSGTARGVDQLGEKYGRINGIKISKFPAKWDKYGRSAGYVRNAQMAKYADALIAVWDEQSKGTKNMIDIATDSGLWVSVFLYEGVYS